MIITLLDNLRNHFLKHLLCVVVFSLTLFSIASASNFAMEPASITTSVDEVIHVDVYAYVEDRPVNTFTAEIVYPTELLQPLSLSGDLSEIDYWFEDETFIQDGVISLEGVSLKEKKGKIKLAEISFLVIAEGKGGFDFRSGLLLSATEGINTVTNFSNTSVVSSGVSENPHSDILKDTEFVLSIKNEKTLDSYEEVLRDFESRSFSCWKDDLSDKWYDLYPQDLYDRTITLFVIGGALVVVSLIWVHMYHKMVRESQRLIIKELRDKEF